MLEALLLEVHYFYGNLRRIISSALPEVRDSQGALALDNCPIAICLCSILEEYLKCMLTAVKRIVSNNPEPCRF